MSKEKTYTIKQPAIWKQCAIYCVATLIFYSVMTFQAHAVGTALCAMIGSIMGGGLARAIATVGVLMVAVGATLGRVSWTLALTVAVGIAAMYSTFSIVNTLSGANGCFGT